MFSKLRKRLTYANVMATMAVFFALGGGAYALSPIATTAATPSGAIVFFNRGFCPGGWRQYTPARGRYLVGLQAGGSLTGTVGTPLSNLENRPTGQFTITPSYTTNWGYAGTTPSGSTRRPLFNFEPADSVGRPDLPAQNSQTIGSVPGTNAPYIELLACRKM